MVVREVDDDAVAAGRRRIERSLERAVHSGKLDRRPASAALGRLHFTTDIGEMADRQLVIEAVIENEAAKLEVFATLDKVVDDAAPFWRPTPRRSRS